MPTSDKVDDVIRNWLISADSHVFEPHDLWTTTLPAEFRAEAPTYQDFGVGEGPRAHPGGRDPNARIVEMEQDNVMAEVLYPTLAMDQFGLVDPQLQDACLGLYNDWLIDYCSHAPARLFGVPMIGTYDIDHAIRELQRCRKAGLLGAMLWQVPPKELSFATDHYERFWDAAQDMRAPISLHIVTGIPYGPRDLQAKRSVPERFSYSVNVRLLQAMDALSDIIASGVLERHPRLKVVLVENEVSWLPFVLERWDKYARRRGTPYSLPLLPSEYFSRQIHVTFFNDPNFRLLVPEFEWAVNNCMWSNDFPHPNSTWPHSSEVIARDLGSFSSSVRDRLTVQNVADLYGLSISPPAAAESDG
jgi:predicted TIM-barrel fold metal-dependent hydrolase